MLHTRRCNRKRERMGLVGSVVVTGVIKNRDPTTVGCRDAENYSGRIGIVLGIEVDRR